MANIVELTRPQTCFDPEAVIILSPPLKTLGTGSYVRK